MLWNRERQNPVALGCMPDVGGNTLGGHEIFIFFLVVFATQARLLGYTTCYAEDNARVVHPILVDGGIATLCGTPRMLDLGNRRSSAGSQVILATLLEMR